jgi:hypothetical protein
MLSMINWKEIQEVIDSFTLKTKHTWISKERIHLQPELGGLGEIKRKKEKLCYLKENVFHKMHVAIITIARDFLKLEGQFTETCDNLIRLKIPNENFKVAKNREHHAIRYYRALPLSLNFLFLVQVRVSGEGPALPIPSFVCLFCSIQRKIQNKPNRSNLVFLISRIQVIISSKLLCLSPIIREVLWVVDTKIVKIRSPGL